MSVTLLRWLLADREGLGKGRSVVSLTCMWRRSFRTVAAACVFGLVVAGAQASVITFALACEFSGATPPEGAVPWLTATFDDQGTPGSVDLTLATTNLTDSEFVFEWLFNLDPVLDAGDLVFSAPTKIGAFVDPTIDLGVDAFSGDGGGYYDVRVGFANSDGSPTRFNVGDGLECTITGVATLTAGSFDFNSAPHGGHGTFPTAAHVGGIGPDDGDSGWVSVPEPGVLCLLVVGGLALGYRRRQARRV